MDLAHIEDLGLHQLAESLAFTATYNPSALASSVGNRNGSLNDKLLDIYLKQCNLQKNVKNSTRASSNLLSTLVHRDSLNTLVVNLKKLTEGYNIEVKSMNGELTETMNLPYEESDLLDFIENEELPHNLVDVLEKTQPELFYDGCVIAELRDMRRSVVPESYKSTYVLLKPSHRSLLADINSLTSDGYRWTSDDRLALESQLLLATSSPLCLDPTPAVSVIHNRMQFKKKALQQHKLMRAIKPYTAKGFLRRKRFNQLSCQDELPVLSFLETRGNKSRFTPPPLNLKLAKPCIDSWIQPPIQLAPVNPSDVQKYAKEYEKPAVHQGSKQTVDCSPVTVEEYILETERPQGKIHRTRLVIMKRNTEDKYIGELHVDRGKSEWSASKSIFDLGTAGMVEKYIQQFIEIFTEEGRRQVKITQNRPGRPSQVQFTQTDQSPGQVSPAQVSIGQAATSSNQGSSPAIVQGNGGTLAQLNTAASSQMSSAANVLKLAIAQQNQSNTGQTNATVDGPNNSLSSSGDSNASLLLTRQGLKVQDGILPTGLHTPRSDADGNLESSIGSDVSSSAKFSAAAALTKTALLRRRSGTPTQSTSSQSINISNSQSNQSGQNQSVPTINLQDLANLNLTNLQGLQNVQVSLASLTSGGIAVPVTLISSSASAGMTGNSIILSGHLPVVENRSTLQTAAGQNSGGTSQTTASTPHSIMVTSSGGQNQIVATPQGLITLPLGSNLSQLVAASKRQQTAGVSQQQLNIATPQQLQQQQSNQQVTHSSPQSTSQLTSPQISSQLRQQISSSPAKPTHQHRSTTSLQLLQQQALLQQQPQQQQQQQQLTLATPGQQLTSMPSANSQQAMHIQANHLIGQSSRLPANQQQQQQLFRKLQLANPSRLHKSGGGGDSAPPPSQ